MPDNTIDTLSIDIKSNSSGASKAINNLITNLTRLNGALNNYSDASEYSKALGNLQSGLKGLNSAIAGLDTGKLKTVASSISSLSSSAKKLNGIFNNVGLDKATRDAKAMDGQIEKATRDIMSFYGTSRNVADSVGKSFREILSGATIKDGRLADFTTDKGWEEFDNLFRTISRNAQKSAVEGGNAYYQELVDYMRGKKIPVHLPFDWSDISGDISDAKSKLATVFGVGGWSFNSKATGDISEFVREMNDALGTQFDTSNDTRAFEELYNALSQARRELSGFSQATTTIDVDMNEFIGVVSNAVNSVRQFDSQVSNASSTAQTNPFSAMADGLKGLQGISIPDLSGIADIAGNIGKLANKKASAGIQMLPALSSGLQSLNSLQGIAVPDLTGLAELISVIGKLGGKKGTAATANLRPMIMGLQQLSTLSGITFPDSTNLASLATAFSMLGRATTGNAIQNIPQLATAFRQLMQTLSAAPKVSQNVIALADAMARLSANGSKVGTASRSLNTGMQKINSAFDGVMQRSKAISTRIMDFGKKLLLSGFHADNTGRRYETLASKIGLLYAKFWMLIRAVKGLNRMIEVASSLTEVQNVVDTTFGKMSGKLEEFAKNSIKDFGMSELSAKQYASQFQAMGTAMGITGQQVQKAQQLLNTRKTMEGAVAGYNKLSNSMADMSINLTKLSADMASFYDIEQSTVAKALQSGVMAGQTRPLRAYGLDLTEATLKEWALKNGLDANIKSMTQAEKTMLRYQYVMANSARAQGDFSRTSKTWHNQIVILKQQLQQLAAVIGSGLIHAIKPFVIQFNAALSGLISFAQKVVNALGKIFGWEMEVNTKGMTIDDDALEDIDTSGLDDIADGADNATKAVKKLKDQLQGFDKLNVLRTTTKNPTSGKNSKDSGSGASGTGAVSDGDITAGLKKTKGVFESNIDNLFDLGRYIGNSLKKALDKIPWNEVYERARGFGKGLAEFLNGLISPELFATLGKTVANSINTALHFLDSFGEHFNFKNFGKSLASGLTSFLNNIQWKTALSAVSNWGQGVADAINSFIKENDFKLVGESIANAIKTVITFWLKLGSGIKWKDIGQALADTVNGAIEKFPAKELAETINVWVQGIRDAFVTFIKKTKWDKVKDKIVEMIKNLDFDTISIIVKTLALIKGASFAISIGGALITEIQRRLAAELAGKIVITLSGLSVKGAGGGALLGEVSAGGILTTLASIVGAIGGVVLAAKGMFDIWTKGWSTARGIMVAAGSGIALAIGLVVGVLTGPLALAIAGAVAAITFLGANWGKIKDGIASKVGELIKSFDALGSDFRKTKSDIGKQFAGMKNDFATMATGIIQKGKTLASDVTGSFASVKTNAGGAVTTFATAVKNQFESMRSDLASKMSSIKSNATEKWGSIKNTISQYASSAKNTVTSVWGALKTDTTSAWSTIKSKTTEVWSSIKSAITDKMSSAKTAVKNAIDKIKGYFKFSWSLPKLKMPHPYVSGSFSLNPPSVPTFGIEWYKKAYDNPFMFTKPTLMPDIKGFGDGNGGEMVYGHANLMNDIREASGGNEMTNIGNRQLANDQRIIQLLTIIAEKEFGISQDQVFRAVRNGASDYTMRTGRGAFEF